MNKVLFLTMNMQSKNTIPSISFYRLYPFSGLILLTTCFSLLTFDLFSQPNTWVSIYGGNKYDRGASLAATTDKSFVICGNTSSYGIGTTDIYILKIDSAGKYQWENTLGGANIDHAHSIRQTTDSGFVISGYTNSFGNAGYNAYLVKVSSAGLLQWQRTYGGDDWDFAYWAEQTNDGGYVLCGESFRSGKNSQAYLIRTDAAGDTIWTQTFGGSGEDAFKEVRQTSDGGFVAAGYATDSTGDKDFFLLKTDALGNTAWEKTYGGSANDSCSSLDICADGGFLLGGCRDTLGKHKTYFVKTDASGNEMLSKANMGDSGNRSISRIRETVEEHYTYTQICDEGGLGGQEIYLIKYDPTGNWFPFVSTLGGNKDEEAYDLIQNADSGYTLVGYTETFGSGPDNIFIARTNAAGSYNNTVNSYVAVSEIQHDDDGLMIYPNPTNGKFQVAGSKFKAIVIRTYNQLGEVILISAGSEKNEIDISAAPNGIYLLEIVAAEGTIRRKILVSK